MRCLAPRTVGFEADGKTIAWSQKKYSKEYAPFQLPCGKCIECRLEYARQWAVRCVHESKMYEDNSFITLTYSDENLKSPKLQYIDFQLFIKRLRKHIFTQFLKSYGKENWLLADKEQRKKLSEQFRIGIFVTGEYGELRKRPHWHALIFNWRPQDLLYKYTNNNGDLVSTSTTLDNLWGLGITEVGTVTFESAGYCARYAAKKLVHGRDGDHSYDPISKKSSKHAIGKRWLELHWRDLLADGQVRLRDGTAGPIPRYYIKWLLQRHPEAYLEFLGSTKEKKIKAAVAANKRDQALRKSRVSKNDARREIQKQKFDYLQSKLKL